MQISIHSSHTGRDPKASDCAWNVKRFQSTLPIREETQAGGGKPAENVFQSTLPIREETDNGAGAGQKPDISIHSSHTGRDPGNSLFKNFDGLFQSTLPIREETAGGEGHHRGTGDFNPLFPYGKRRRERKGITRRENFNPLFPYGKRQLVAGVVLKNTLFQSTLPIREETRLIAHQPDDLFLFQSTLPIREETGFAAQALVQLLNFNPLFPYGKRLSLLMISRSASGFQSTLPIREETRGRRWEKPSGRRFQSTLPIREETILPLYCKCIRLHISIHSSHTGRDLPNRAAADRYISIHSSHTGRDAMMASASSSPIFQSTLPIREET